MTDYRLLELAGHQLTQADPIFSTDGRKLFVPSGADIRIYCTITGKVDYVLDSGRSVLGKDVIVRVQKHPTVLDHIIVFSMKGVMAIINVPKNRVILSVDLFRRLYRKNEVPQESALKYGLASQETNKNKPTRFITIFFMVEKDFRTYLTTVEDPFFAKQHPVKAKKPLDKLLTEVHKIIIVDKKEWDKGNALIDFSPTGTFVAGVVGQKFVVRRWEGSHGQVKKDVPQHFYNRVDFTSLAIHPTTDDVATGDSEGKILIWRRVLSGLDRSCVGQYHWHPDAVLSLSFSPLGHFMYSVGKEATVVCWDIVKGPGHKPSHRPRLGVPINRVVGDSNNNLLALTMSDNTIRVIGTDFGDLSNNRDVELSEMTFDIFKNSIDRMAFDPITQSIVTTGRPGELLFYSVKDRSKVKSLDVVARNFFFMESLGHNHQILVTAFDVALDGSWIATVESRDDLVTFFEERLKFFQFKGQKGYQQRTTIHLPHDDKISDLKFAPKSDLLITIGNITDNTFKIWKLVKPLHEEPFWTEHRTCSRNHLWTPRMTSFSFDSSLVAVEYLNWSIDRPDRSHLTLWQTSSGDLDMSANIDDLWEDTLVGISFGSGTKGHLFVEVRGTTIRVHDFLSDERIKWRKESPEDDPFVRFTFDQLNNLFVCLMSSSLFLSGISGDRQVLVDIKDMMPIPVHDITTSLLVPSTAIGVTNSEPSFIFFGRDKKLLGICPPDQDQPDGQSMDVAKGDGPRGSIQLLGKNVYVDGRKKNQKKIPTRSIAETFDGDKTVQSLFLDLPSHAMAGIDLLAKVFMKSLFFEEQVKPVIRRKPTKMKRLSTSGSLDDNDEAHN